MSDIEVTETAKMRMIWGKTLLHKICQQCLKNGLVLDTLTNILDDIVHGGLGILSA